MGIPEEFLRGEVVVNHGEKSYKHTIFYNSNAIPELETAVVGYWDATFKVGVSLYKLYPHPDHRLISLPQISYLVYLYILWLLLSN